MKLFIYNVETKEIVEKIIGDSNQECEDKAAEANYDEEMYGWTYCENGLIEV